MPAAASNQQAAPGEPATAMPGEAAKPAAAAPLSQQPAAGTPPAHTAGTEPAAGRAAATSTSPTVQPVAAAKLPKSFRSRIGDLAAKITPGHGRSAAKEPRPSKSKAVMRHEPDSALSAQAKASLRTKQFGAAMQELRTAAEHGDVESEYLLGLVYASGVAPEVSLTEARRWLEAAASKSNPRPPWLSPVCWRTARSRSAPPLSSGWPAPQARVSP